MGGICAAPVVYRAVCFLLVESQKYLICLFGGVTVSHALDHRILPSLARHFSEVTRVF